MTKNNSIVFPALNLIRIATAWEIQVSPYYEPVSKWLEQIFYL
jgi:hypothetical protein